MIDGQIFNFAHAAFCLICRYVAAFNLFAKCGDMAKEEGVALLSHACKEGRHTGPELARCALNFCAKVGAWDSIRQFQVRQSPLL